MNANISSLYVLKALGSFFVIACHAPLEAMPATFRDLGVPCFFIISGYFLYNRDIEVVKRRATKGMRKALILTTLLTPIYFIIDPIDVSQTTFPVALRWFFVSIPNKYGGPLWYLVALFWGLFSFRFFLNAFKGKGIYWLIGFTLLGLAIGRYRFLLNSSVSSSYFTLNFLSYALPCLSIGYLAKREEDLLNKVNALDYAVWLSVLLCIESNIVSYLSEGRSSLGPYMLTFPTAFAWFMVALQHKSFGASSFVEKIGKNHSARIYYWHMLFVWAFTLLDDSILAGIGFRKFGTIYVFALSLILSMSIHYISKRITFESITKVILRQS